eukprot:414136_1
MYHSFEDYAEFYRFASDKWIVNQLIPSLKSIKTETKRRIMIIGAGPEPSVDLLIDHFDELILIEPNKLYINEWKLSSWWSKCKKLNKHITIIPTVIEELWLQPHKYASILQFHSINAIMTTHVAYYFPIKYMLNLISFLIALLKPENSILCIGVDDDELDICAQIMKQMTPDYSCSKLIENALHKMDIKYYKLIELQKYNMENMDNLVKTMKFFVKEGAFCSNWFSGKEITKNQEQKLNKIILNTVNDQLQKNKRNGDELYVLPSYTSHYVIQSMTSSRCKL